MNISFGSAVSERNERERGLTFSLVGQLDWSGEVIEVDERKEYVEQRYRVLGLPVTDSKPWCSHPALARCTSSACARRTNES